jgi:methylated-DNA-[protein]-cysteine S-methyltransferase
MLYYARLATPIGCLHLYATDSELKGVFFDSNLAMARKIVTASLVSEDGHHLLNLAKQQLNEYFAGERTQFSLPISPAGTSFQRAAWSALQQIPFGQAISYAEQAHMIGDPNAHRAVARCNGMNLLSIIIPCHRVIRSTGALGGYAGGMTAKNYLLKLERSLIKKGITQNSNVMASEG